MSWNVSRFRKEQQGRIGGSEREEIAVVRVKDTVPTKNRKGECDGVML